MRIRSRFAHGLALILVALLFSAPFSAEAALSGKAAVILDLQDVRTVGAETATSKISREFIWTLSNGIGANQANRCYQGVRTLTTAATEDLDVSGTLANLFETATFTKVKLIVFSAASTNSTTITVSRPAANGLTLFAAVSDALAPLKAGGFFAYADPSLAGIAVTAGTADLITVTNSAGASAVYTVVICGVS